MTYYETYSLLKSEAELKLTMERDTIVAFFLGGNLDDRLKTIEEAGNKVANEKGWTEQEGENGQT